MNAYNNVHIQILLVYDSHMLFIRKRQALTLIHERSYVSSFYTSFIVNLSHGNSVIVTHTFFMVNSEITFICRDKTLLLLIPNLHQMLVFIRYDQIYISHVNQWTLYFIIIIKSYSGPQTLCHVSHFIEINLLNFLHSST